MLLRLCDGPRPNEILHDPVWEEIIGQCALQVPYWAPRAPKEEWTKEQKIYHVEEEKDVQRTQALSKRSDTTANPIPSTHGRSMEKTHRMLVNDLPRWGAGSGLKEGGFPDRGSTWTKPSRDRIVWYFVAEGRWPMTLESRMSRWVRGKIHLL